jgi:hypothetical protein
LKRYSTWPPDEDPRDHEIGRDEMAVTLGREGGRTQKQRDKIDGF